MKAKLVPGTGSNNLNFPKLFGDAGTLIPTSYISGLSAAQTSTEETAAGNAVANAWTALNTNGVTQTATQLFGPITDLDGGSESASFATNVSFVDYDLDQNEIAGNLRFADSSSFSTSIAVLNGYTMSGVENLGDACTGTNKCAAQGRCADFCGKAGFCCEKGSSVAACAKLQGGPAGTPQCVGRYFDFHYNVFQHWGSVAAAGAVTRGGNRLAYPRIGYVSYRFQTGFKPVSDQFQTSAICRICGGSPCCHSPSPPPCPVHVTVSHVRFLDSEHVGCTGPEVSCRICGVSFRIRT